jgi:type I site-specific restriction endonuclease
MQALNLPPYPFRIFKEGEKYKILDPIRKKRLILTPEEWVRQHMIMYLVKEKNFPAGLLKTETGVKHHQRFGRTDALFLNREGKPLVLIECKAPDVNLNRETFYQVARYNSTLESPYIIMTNGLEHMVIHLAIQERKILALSDLPEYKYL